MWRPALAGLLVVALAVSAQATTWYVANNGVDGAGCGLKASPCRSIGQAVNFIAAAGDTVVVGPGKYGPPEETGGFGCVLVVAQTVTLTSSDGAAATIIEGRNPGPGCTVGLLADGTHFGKPGKGFTVTGAATQAAVGIELAGTDLVVSGNQVLGSSQANSSGSAGTGIQTPSNSKTALITGNEVLRWSTGIVSVGSGKTISKNQTSQNAFGIYVDGQASISGNVVTDNDVGIQLTNSGALTIVGNAVHGNRGGGLLMRALLGLPFVGKIEKNNIFANGCGIDNGDAGVAGLLATNNYWGAATGPGPSPADLVCDSSGGSSTVTPFATKPFSVKAPVKF